MENDEMKLSVVGQCRECGQLVVYDVEAEPEDVDAGATFACVCPKGARLRMVSKAHIAVENVCVKLAEQHGFVPLEAEQVEQIKGVCERIIDGAMQSAAYKISGQDEVRLRVREKDGRLMVKRVRKTELELG